MCLYGWHDPNLTVAWKAKANSLFLYVMANMHSCINNMPRKVMLVFCKENTG